VFVSFLLVIWYNINKGGMMENENQNEPKSSNELRNIVIAVIVTVVVLVAIMIGIFTWIKGKAGVNNTSPTPTATVTISATSTATSGAEALQGEDHSSAFENQVNGAGQFGSTLADTVNFILSGTECCGDLAKSQAETELINRIQSAMPFDFTETSQLAKNIKTNLTQFDGYTIGIGADEGSGPLVLAYYKDSDGLISKIFIAPSNELDTE